MQNYFASQAGLYHPENEHDSCGIGFVASIKGQKSHEIVKRGLEVLVNMTHRGAESSDNVSGDGAGITLQIPHQFFKTKVPNLPSAGNYGAGTLFLPVNESDREACETIFYNLVKQENLEIIATRDVPVNNSVVGEIAHTTEPFMKQVFIKGDYEQDDLERKLYVVRKLAEKEVSEFTDQGKELFLHSQSFNKDHGF
jgi:glutamate synthase (NADPH) large chain